MGIIIDTMNTVAMLDGNATMTGDPRMGSHRIIGVRDPVDYQVVASKAYVDIVKAAPMTVHLEMGSH